jgi:hypothetical protein
LTAARPRLQSTNAEVFAMPSKAERLSLREASNLLHATYFPVADDASDDEFNASADRADDVIRFGIMSGVPWWHVPAGGVWSRPGADLSLLREPDWHEITKNELRLKTNRDGIFDGDKICREPADFTQVTIDRQALEAFVRDTLKAKLAKLPAKPGPQPTKREGVEDAMRADIRSGKHTSETLNTKKIKELASDYNTSPSTARRACQTVLIDLEQTRTRIR